MKDWFGSARKGGKDRPVSVDILIAEGQFEEAEQHLRRRLKSNRGDLYSQLKLADLLMKTRRQREAVDEYLLAAESYARDGFYDKATALLRKIAKLAPTNESIALKIQALDRAKNLERRRDLILASLTEGDAHLQGRRTSAIQWQQLWSSLSQTSVVESLSDDQLRRLFAATELVRFDEDQEVVAAGDKKEEMYLVSKGIVEARIPLKGDAETAIRSFRAGDLIGDRALLEHQPWPARYVAAERTTALRLDKEGLAKALTGETDPRGFLETLRSQKQDHQVLSAIRELEAVE